MWVRGALTANRFVIFYSGMAVCDRYAVTSVHLTVEPFAATVITVT